MQEAVGRRTAGDLICPHGYYLTDEKPELGEAPAQPYRL